MWTEQTHVLPLHSACPISANPLPGSQISIRYEPVKTILEVASLRAYIDSYTGGKDEVRSMEGMIQAIAQDAADALATHVIVFADLLIDPNQQMKLKCNAFPRSDQKAKA